MLMGTHDGAVDEVYIPVNLAQKIGLGLNGCKDRIPDAGSAPAIEARGNGLPGTIALRQITPGCPRTQDPENAVDDATMIVCRTSRITFLGRQPGTEPLPLFVSQITSVHAL